MWCNIHQLRQSIQPHFSLRRIEPYQIMIPTSGAVIRPLVDRLLLANGVTRLRDQIETVSDAFGRAYVQQTDAIWIISEGVVARDVAEGNLALLHSQQASREAKQC